MAFMRHKIGRKEVWFSDHALDRYWQRYMDQHPHAGRKEARATLEQELDTAWMSRNQPPWARMSRWHAARLESLLFLDDGRAFVTVKNPGGDIVAVTYICKEAPCPSSASVRHALASTPS